MNVTASTDNQTDRLEQVAKALHDGWWEWMRKHGEQHRHMVEWDSLPKDESRNQDRFQAAVLLRNWVGTLEPVTPEGIHEAWRLWERIHGKQHSHDAPFVDVHSPTTAHGVREHQVQADKVNALLKSWHLDPKPYV